MTRTGIGARLRFEILKRDNFRCQYCGAAAPHVQLQIEHILPIVAGGTNDPDNLCAACQRCNAGKAAIELDDRLPAHSALNEIAAGRAKQAHAAAVQLDMDDLIGHLQGALECDDIQPNERAALWRAYQKWGYELVDIAIDTNCGSPWCESRETLFANLDSYSAEAANDFCSADDIAAVAGRA